MKPVERIYAADLAKVMNKSPLTARRLLIALEQEHGEIVVHRDGRERYSTWDAIEQVTDLRRPTREKSYDEAKLMSTLRRVLVQITGFNARLDEVETGMEKLDLFLAKHGMRSG